MNAGRRTFFSGIAVLLAGMREFLWAGQRQGHGPQFPDPNAPGGPNEVPLPPLADPKLQLKENQKNLRSDVDRLIQMAKDLKEEVDKTQETDVLSLSMVKKAEDIEKLARQIRDLIRAT